MRINQRKNVAYNYEFILNDFKKRKEKYVSREHFINYNIQVVFDDTLFSVITCFFVQLFTQRKK